MKRSTLLLCVVLTGIITACATSAPDAGRPVTMEEAKAAVQRKDYAAAMSTYRTLAEKGNVDAMLALGSMYDNGPGVPRNTVEAAKWYRMGAQKGHLLMQRALALKYAIGEGVPVDNARAYTWISLAAAGGADVKKDMDLIARRATPKEMAEAQRMIAQCKTRPSACD